MYFVKCDFARVFCGECALIRIGRCQSRGVLGMRGIFISVENGINAQLAYIGVMVVHPYANAKVLALFSEHGIQ